MNTITEELVTIDINGRTIDCYVWGYFHPAYDGGRDEPSEHEVYELTHVYTEQDGKQFEISEVLMFEFVRESIINQLKENVSE